MNCKYSIITILIFTILFINLNYALTGKTSKKQKLLLLCKKKCHNRKRKLKRFCKKCRSLNISDKSKTPENNIIFVNNKISEYKEKSLSNDDKNKISASLKSIKILSCEETLDEIIYNNKSISRFGDGDLGHIFGKSNGYQLTNKELSKRLKNVLQSNKEDLIISLPDMFKKKNIYNAYWKSFKEEYESKIIKLLNPSKIYGNTNISRFYWYGRNRNYVLKYINKLKMIWDKKDVIIIEGEKTRFGINNDLIDNAKSVKRILCPAKNAYEKYDKIYHEALKISKEKLVLIALGPTATILAYDLHNAGYQAIDIGHADISYEWFLRNATKKIKIEYKYVNEAKDGNKDIKDVVDKNYYDQILVKITDE